MCVLLRRVFGADIRYRFDPGVVQPVAGAIEGEYLGVVDDATVRVAGPSRNARRRSRISDACRIGTQRGFAVHAPVVDGGDRYAQVVRQLGDIYQGVPTPWERRGLKLLRVCSYSVGATGVPKQSKGTECNVVASHS